VTVADRPEREDAIDLSIIVIMGYQGQTNLSAPVVGDEFEHLAEVANTKHNVELIIVDKAWPYRSKRVIRTLESMLARVRYIPPRPTLLTSRGYFGVSSAMNSGGVCSQGQLLMFVGDFMRLQSGILDEVCDAFYEEDKLLHPVIQSISESLNVEKEQIFSGHNSGIKVCARHHFEKTWGWEEYFDGAYGEDDVEWQQRLDLLNNEEGVFKRVRRLGIDFHRSYHENGVMPIPFRPLWDQPVEHKRVSLRCNRVFYQSVVYPRLDRGEYRGNQVVTPEELAVLRAAKCSDHCEICNREDRSKQLRSYAMQDLPNIPLLMSVMERTVGHRSGVLDPWNGHQLNWDAEFEEELRV
jgi:hypothetical protein